MRFAYCALRILNFPQGIHMTHILLLGAGFSRNWGGLLATEIFELLISQETIAHDGYLRELLWNHKANGGFENALAEVQVRYSSDPVRYGPSLDKFQTAVSNVFGRMNAALFNIPGIEFQQDIDRLLRTFLVRFDAIFTLNQDVLLEHHYFRHVELAGPRRWIGAQMPGLKRIPNATEIIDQSWEKDTWVPLEKERFLVEAGFQPCFKLHGSSNWIDSEGGPLLVIGGNKGSAIQSHAVLGWYFEKFREYLSVPDARLCVIGYGFRDSHVNEVIIEAISNSNLKLFVIDPSGSEVAMRANPSFGGAVYVPNALDDAFRQGLIGASRRGLSETFGNDPVSHDHVMNYFKNP